MSAGAPVLVWFRDDLRVDDHPALRHAARTGRPVVPCWIDEPAGAGGVRGAAARWWRHHALARLAAALAERGVRLVLRRGAARDAVPALVRETGAAEVCHLRRWRPDGRRADAETAAALADAGVAVRTFPADLLAEPDQVATGEGTPYRVFTPFWRALQRRGDPPRPRPAPRTLAAPPVWPRGEPLDALGLLPRVDWAGGLRAAWRPDAEDAEAVWAAFRDDALAGYAEGRDRPAERGTSRLSPYLAAGEVSVRRLWHDALDAAGPAAAEPWRRQLAWRDFAHHLLHHFPRTAAAPLDARFAAYPWREDGDALAAWQRGRTGYPVVDAGMRELWTTGWMHNRVRMVVASFLVKHLLLPWQEGRDWFADTLVDHDEANNVLGWQWTAGCGADAAPFFRIFNPVTQGRRHDPAAAYVARWVPELTALPPRLRHAPWEMPAGERRRLGVILGETYPRPLVDHAGARRAALEAWDEIKRLPRTAIEEDEP